MARTGARDILVAGFYSFVLACGESGCVSDASDSPDTPCDWWVHLLCTDSCSWQFEPSSSTRWIHCLNRPSCVPGRWFGWSRYVLVRLFRSYRRAVSSASGSVSTHIGSRRAPHVTPSMTPRLPPLWSPSPSLWRIRSSSRATRPFRSASISPPGSTCMSDARSLGLRLVRRLCHGGPA
jgi:hypothetical protein